MSESSVTVTNHPLWGAAVTNQWRPPSDVRIEHGDGDYTILLGHVISGWCNDAVEVDYSFLDEWDE
jgi:hypothetical protein